MNKGPTGRWLGVLLGVLIGLALAVVLGPYVSRALGGHRAPPKTYVIEGGF